MFLYRTYLPTVSLHALQLTQWISDQRQTLPTYLFPLASSCPLWDLSQPPGQLLVSLRSGCLQVFSFMLRFPNVLHRVFNCFLPRVGSVAVQRKDQALLFSEGPSASLFSINITNSDIQKWRFHHNTLKKSFLLSLSPQKIISNLPASEISDTFLLKSFMALLPSRSWSHQKTAYALTLLGYKHRWHPAIHPSSLLHATAPQLSSTIRPQIHQPRPGLLCHHTFVGTSVK